VEGRGRREFGMLRGDGLLNVALLERAWIFFI
jgi:hypothetical protein